MLELPKSNQSECLKFFAYGAGTRRQSAPKFNPTPSFLGPFNNLRTTKTICARKTVDSMQMLNQPTY